MRVYTADFVEVAVTAQQDFFQIEALTTPVVFLCVELGQTNIVTDANQEIWSVLFRRFTDGVTNDIAEALVDLGDAALLADLAINETTELVTGTEVVHANTWNLALPYIWMPPPELRIQIEIGNGLAINLNTTPAGSTTVSGTIYLGQAGSSS